MLSVYEPTSNPSQVGNKSADGRWCSSASCQLFSQEGSERETAPFEFPSWEGSCSAFFNVWNTSAPVRSAAPAQERTSRRRNKDQLLFR